MAKVKLYKGFKGVYEIGKNRIATKNLVPGVKVYNEKLVKIKGVEYRIWNPHRSKLASSLLKGLKEMKIEPGATVLYLGSATGTTVSHVSDIIWDNTTKGICYCVEFSPRAMKEFITNVASYRKNVVPILGDARKPEDYEFFITDKVDVVYQDVAQPDQTEILIKNVELFLRPGGYIYYAIKAKSIDVTKDVGEVITKEINMLKESNIHILQIIKIKPYHKDHVMVVGRYEP